MKKVSPLGILVGCALVIAGLLSPPVAQADSCDSNRAQSLARQGYEDLSLRRWSDAKSAAGNLILLSQDCDQNDIRVPAVVHSAYIGSAALHALGDDSRAAEGVKAGLMLLDMLQKSGEYKSLYDAMQPRFIELQRQLKS